MGEWLIYGSNGSQKAMVKKLEYSGEFMGETSVTCDIYSPSPISFSIGDYLVYRGERFTIDYDATRLKQARNNTYGKGYTYENMRFLSYVGELKKCEFLDFVPSDNLIHFSQLPDFSFYAETVNDLADRIQANLDRIYTGGKAWTVQVVQGFEGKENINVSVSKSTCFDALRMAYEQFEATFIIRGRTITIGTAGNELETDFRYGKGNGLKTIERSVDESDAIVTRLRAYGNTTNMPANYYKNIGMKVYAPIYEIYHVSTTGCDIHFVPKLKNACFNDKNGQYNYWVSVSLDETLWLKAVASPNIHLSSTNYSVVTVGLYDGNTQAMVTQFNTQLQSGTYNKLYFKQGINVGAWPVEYREYAENVPDLMAIDRLMLPGFPELTTDPYIDSSNIATLGVREKSVYFDGSDPDTPDIHPTLEGMTAAELRAAGYVIDLDSGDNGNLDEIAADATETDGSPITADGAFEGVDEVPGFKVTIKDIGFDINDYLSTETATLVMKTGMCGGMEFTIVKVDKVGNKYVLECQRTEDVAHYFPYNPYLIKAGDKFVLTNLEMPKAYIDAASQRLLTAAQEYIAKYSEPQWVYAIKMDDVWMQRQRDNSVSEASSYYWNIKEGDVMNVTDSDLGIDITEVIDRLSIREGFGPIPEFEVVLRKEKPQGTIGVLQNRIRQLELRNAEQVSTIYRQQNYIDLIIGDKLNTIQEQLDHVQVTYFGDYAPALNNEPASTWQSSEYSEHDGDMFYNRTTGKGYEFTYQNGTWGWIEIQDEDIRQALEEAAAAQDTADGKRRVFVTPAGTLPTPPYDENDLWVNATYPSNSTSTDESQHKYYNDILKCVTPKAEGGTASINDWTLASKYTDDSSLNAFINGSYADDLEDIQNQIDGKAETWYQSTDPSTAWTTTALKNQHKGDIWHNSSNTTINGVKAGQDAIWNGTAWVVDETVPQSVYDTIDGKAAIYVTWGAWGNDLQVKDLFIPSANTTQGGVTYKANKVYRCTNKSTPTFQEIAYTDDAALNAFLNGYTGTLTGIRGDITTAQTTADNAATAASNANTAAAAAQATADALDYLKQAYSADNTLIDHGLILSTIVALRDSSNNVWSGISGAYDSTKLGNGIAAWFGGGMIDKEVSAVSNAAKSLFRFDGSGYVASGNLKWDVNGNVIIQGYSINATTLKVGDANVATQAMLDNFVSKAFFNRLFTAYDANGNAIVPNDTTTAISNLKILVGTWTEQYLSALGLNSQGGGGGTGDVSHIKVSTNPDVYLDPDSDGIIDMSDYVSTIAERNNWNTANANINRLMARVPSATFNTGNELADKAFVNSSISTATATFRGTVTASNDTDAAAATALATISTKDINDYAFVKVENTPQTGVDKYKRYKYNGTSWVYEFTLNNSSFTSDQWNAINSGINTSLVTKLNGIASGAQVNVIESVKVNGTALSISSKAVDITAVPLTIITGADDLKAIEGLSGTSGFLKKTAANTWALDTTVVLNTRKITAGTGLTGGGNLQQDITISLATSGVTASTYRSVTVDVYGRVTGGTNPTTLSGYGITDAKIENGVITLGSNTITPVTSVAMTVPTGFSISGTPISKTGTLALTFADGYEGFTTTLKNKIDLLYSLFTREGAGTAASPYVIKANYGLYTNQFLSSLGQNSQGGSGDFDEEQMWIALGTDVEEKVIDSSHIPDTSSLYGYLKASSLNGYATQEWVTNNFNMYTLPLAASGTRGGVQIGFSENNSGTGSTRNYAVKLSSEKMYVNVPWENTTYSAGAGIGISSGTIINNGVRSITKHSTTAYDILLINTGGTIDYLDLSHQHSYWEILDKPTDLEGFGLTDELNALYVTALGTSGNYLTWTKNGSTSNITIPYATLANTATTAADTSNTLYLVGVTSEATTTLKRDTSISVKGSALNAGSVTTTGDVSVGGTLGVIGATTLTGLLTANGNIVTGTSDGAFVQIGAIKLVYDSTNNALKVIKSDNTSANIYATGAVSALGANSSGGGGGDFDEEQMWEALGTNTTTKVIATSHIPDMAGIYGYLKQSSLSGYVTSVKVGSTAYNPSSGVVSLPAYPTKVSQLTNDSGYVTSSGVTSVTLKAGIGISLDVDNTAITSTGTRTITNSGVRSATINGNYLRVNTNGTNADLTIPYATSAGSVAWGNVSGKPTTVSGYGITDAVFNISRQVDGILKYYVGSTANYLDFSHNHSYWEILDRPTDLEGFGLEDELNTNYVTITTNQTITGTKIFSAQVTANGLMLSTTKKIYFGDTSHYLELNSTGFHFSHGVYSDSFMSALGANSGGGGGGDFSEDQMWAALQGNTGTYANEKINANHIPDTSSLYGYLKSSALSGYVTSVKVGTTAYNPSSGVVSLPAYPTVPTKVSAFTNDSGYVTSSGVTSVAAGTGLTGGTITSTGTVSISSTYRRYISNGNTAYEWGNHANAGYALASSLSSYLPLTGGTITGTINRKMSADTSNYEPAIYFVNVASGTKLAEIGYWNTAQKVYINPIGSSDVYNDATGKYSLVIGNNALTYNTYTIYHAGNSNTTSVDWSCQHLTIAGNESSNITTVWNDNGAITTNSPSTNAAIRHAIRFNWYSTSWEIGNIRDSSDGTHGFGITSGNSTLVARFTTSGAVVYGEVTATSDARQKTLLGDTNLSVKQIADAPNIKFLWNDNRDEKTHIGSLAQYWDNVLPEAVTKDGTHGYMSLNYGALALCSAITIARMTINHEDRITMLERENAKLKARIAELEERRVA